MERDFDDEWFPYEEGDREPTEGVDPADLPWTGTPWPPYLPMPDGSWVGITRDNIMLCTPAGWRWVAARIFDLCERTSGAQIKALSQHQGRLLVRIGVHEAIGGELWLLSSKDQLEVMTLAKAVERLCGETLLMCEVCGGPVELDRTTPRCRTLCEDHFEGRPIQDTDTQNTDDDFTDWR